MQAAAEHDGTMPPCSASTPNSSSGLRDHRRRRLSERQRPAAVIAGDPTALAAGDMAKGPAPSAHADQGRRRAPQPFMALLRDRLPKAIADVELRDPNRPVIANVDADPTPMVPRSRAGAAHQFRSLAPSLLALADAGASSSSSSAPAS